MPEEKTKEKKTGKKVVRKRRKSNKYRCKEGDLVLVEWTDACISQSWVSRGTLLGPADCESVGWVHSITGKVLEIFSERGPGGVDGDINLRTSIPKSCVRKVTVK